MRTRVFVGAVVVFMIMAAGNPGLCASPSVPDTAHAMAGELDAQLADRLGTNTPVKGVSMLATTPADLENLQRVAPIARLLNEEMIGWFVASGYRVSEMRKGRYILTKPETGELLLTRRADMLTEKFPNAELILAGTYTGTAKHFRFNMRLIKASTGEIVAMSSRTLALSPDTAELAGEERQQAYSRLRPSVGTRLEPKETIGQKALGGIADLFSGYTPGANQHPVYAPN
jgi:hypothetical protein